MADTTDITLYLVGWDKEEAMDGLVFNSYESAESYVYDNCDRTGEKPDIYSVSAFIHFDTMEII